MEIFGRLQLYNCVGYFEEWIRKEIFLVYLIAYLSKAVPAVRKNTTPFLFLMF